MVGDVFVWKCQKSCIYLIAKDSERGILLSDLFQLANRHIHFLQMGIKPKTMRFGFILWVVSDFLS